MLVFDAARCTGCRYCEVACVSRDKGAFGVTGSRINIITQEKALIHAAVFCRHCKNPPCVGLCPVGAIATDEETGLVEIDPEKCTGCGLCLACPLGGISLDRDTGIAVNCDLCDGRPACAEFCPAGALQYVFPGAEARKLKDAII